MSDREQRLLEMVEQGMTYAEIGRAEGISRQRVFQIIGGRQKPHFRELTEKECVYIGIRNWLNEHRMSRAKLAREMYGYYHTTKVPVVNGALMGSDTSKHTIDAILRVTGLTYEQAFGGAIVQPCKVGDIVYTIFEGDIEALKVTYTKAEESAEFVYRYYDARNKFLNMPFTDRSIGKTVFLTKEEAEGALKERESGG